MSNLPACKISFCVACMNRAYHLKKTILKNILNNLDYPELEIVLLDYNSADDLEPWAKEELGEYIGQGKVVYYKTFDPAVFSHSHSKNLVFKLANGTVVCNLSCDNFVGPDFAGYINRFFQEHKDAFLCPDLGKGFDPGTAGAICIKKNDFLNVGGFDERMAVYGWEDIDLIRRLMLAGLERKDIKSSGFITAIQHGDNERYDPDKLLSKIHAVYASSPDPIDEPRSGLYLLHNDRSFRSGTVINNANRDAAATGTPLFQYEIEGFFWAEGYWREEPSRIQLFDKAYKTGQVFFKKVCDDRTVLQSSDKETFLYHITNIDLLSKIAYFEMDYHNRMIMIQNQRMRKITVNNGVFGRASVFKNFDYSRAIQVN